MTHTLGSTGGVLHVGGPDRHRSPTRTLHHHHEPVSVSPNRVIHHHQASPNQPPQETHIYHNGDGTTSSWTGAGGGGGMTHPSMGDSPIGFAEGYGEYGPSAALNVSPSRGAVRVTPGRTGRAKNASTNARIKNEVISIL